MACLSFKMFLLFMTNDILWNRDREDLKREEYSNQKLVEENEELRNTVFEMEQQ